MSRVLTFSRTYPSYHPRAGQPTYFVEQFQNCLCSIGIALYHGIDPPMDFLESLTPLMVGYKHHTIRAGHRWKAGDWFSPRVWSGKPYNSKQITFAPDIQVKKTWDFAITVSKKKEPIWLDREQIGADTVGAIARADGLSFVDFMHWFKYPGTPFDGQIICWNESINY